MNIYNLEIGLLLRIYSYFRLKKGVTNTSVSGSIYFRPTEINNKCSSSRCLHNYLSKCYTLIVFYLLGH